MEDMALKMARLNAEAGQREEKLRHTIDLLRAECFQRETELQSLKGVGLHLLHLAKNYVNLCDEQWVEPLA